VLTASPPFGKANDLTKVKYTSPSQHSFKKLTIDSAPCYPKVIMKGAVNSPALAFGDCIFYADFNDCSLDATDVERQINTGTYSGSLTQGYLFYHSVDKMGLYVRYDSNGTLSWTSLYGNPSEGTWVIRFQPTWDYTQASGKYLFQHYYDGDNYIRVQWDASGDKWRFVRYENGNYHMIASEASTHSAWDVITIVIAYGPEGMKMFVDSVKQSHTDSNTDAMASPPNKLNMQNQGQNMNADIVVDLLQGFARQLTDEECIAISKDPEMFKNWNVKVGYEDNISADDFVVINSEACTCEFFDRSANTLYNKADKMTGEFPVLWPTINGSDSNSIMLYNKSSSTNELVLQYRKAYL
jgi:hypothetical protein